MKIKITDGYIKRYDPVFVYTDAWNFSSEKNRLESLGYTGTPNANNTVYVFRKANSVFLKIAEDGKVIGEFDFHDIILRHTGKQRISDAQIVDFVAAVNSGKITLVKSGKSFVVT